MENLGQRTLTGMVLVIVTTFSILLSPYSFFSLILAINILGLREFYRLYDGYAAFPRNIGGTILSMCVLLTFTLVITNRCDWRILFINMAATFALFIMELYLRSKHPFHNLAFIFLGVICITVPLCFFIALAFLPGSTENYPYVVMGYFIVLWLNDSGAYFAGKYFGKRPLFLRLSPKKTWEGSFGGAICAVSATFVLSRSFPVLNWIEWLGMALIIIITGTFGDLIKSMMKRSLNIKDAGNILPGHGGILDRFDSLLGSAPFVFCYLSLSGHA